MLILFFYTPDVGGGGGFFFFSEIEGFFLDDVHLQIITSISTKAFVENSSALGTYNYFGANWVSNIIWWGTLYKE